MKPIIETEEWGYYRYKLADKDLDSKVKRLRFQFPDGQIREKNLVWKERMEEIWEQGRRPENITSLIPHIECYPFKVKALVPIAGLLAEWIKEKKQ